MKGIYCLVIRLEKDARIRIGSLGELFFEKGSYVYVGSAMNGLENRIARHLRYEKKLHWHIDYMLSNKCARITQVLAKEAGKSHENPYACPTLKGGACPDFQAVSKFRSALKRVASTFESEECATAEKIARIGNCVEDFECSDCKCISHLFKIKGKITLPGFTVFSRKHRI
ncbi:MAG: GIY-YIG nuclease family protein [Nanoarchaeota archaeon]|nr:GIY-YIG nuclease family protein [Nanoarchaeota archaeon]MBU4299802.1 GIY-YIG nuclease family protein [Nanoarchaeota archaeon]MBU4452208.1 GIY-YIG nuclease family protein [Nanoarchaeota archaeon]MCG2723594.1 GIY-YIG nuclease family protein [archaeon]